MIQSQKCIKQWLKRLCFPKGMLMSYYILDSLKCWRYINLKRVLLPMQLKPFATMGFLDPEVEAGEVSVLLIDLAKCRPCLKILTVSPDDSQTLRHWKGRWNSSVRRWSLRSFETLKTTLRWIMMFFFHETCDFHESFGFLGDALFYSKVFIHETSWSKRNPLTKKTKGRNIAAVVDVSLRWTWCTWATDKILKKSHPRWADASTFFQRGFFGGWGWVGRGLRFLFPKNVCSRCCGWNDECFH